MARQGDAAKRNTLTACRMQPELAALDAINPCQIINAAIIPGLTPDTLTPSSSITKYGSSFRASLMRYHLISAD
jgi:hypothetical protein